MKIRNSSSDNSYDHNNNQKVFRILISCYNKATMNKKIAMKNTPAGSLTSQPCYIQFIIFYR